MGGPLTPTLYLGDVKSQTFGVMTSTVWGHVTS